MLITLEQYAMNHNVGKRTIDYHITTGNLKAVRKYGKNLIDSRTKYPKNRAGRPAKKVK